MRTWLPLAHLALTLVILVWDVVLAGRISQVRKAPRAFAAITALAGFLIAPGVAISVATSSAITGRALVAVDWLWPLAALLFAIQAIYALARRLVNTFVGLPIAVYDVLVAAAVVLRYLAFRVVVAFVAAGWTTLIAVGLPRGQIAVHTYDNYATARLEDRPAGDFLLGVKILPDLARAPSVRAIRNDLALVDTLGVDAVSVVIVPDAATGEVLDSVARIVEPLRRADSTLLIVSLGYRGKLIPSLRPQDLDVEARLRAVNQVVRRL